MKILHRWFVWNRWFRSAQSPGVRLRVSATGVLRLVVPESEGFMVLRLDQISSVEMLPKGTRIRLQTDMSISSTERFDLFKSLLIPRGFQLFGGRFLLNTEISKNQNVF